MGRIATFYSYKGGTGRSMALANVAWGLASHGHSVLAVDWDLEAPGLHRYFRPFLVDKELTAPESTGLIDFVRSYVAGAATPRAAGTAATDWYVPYADVARWVIPLRKPDGTPLVFANSAEISLLSAGRQDGDYARHVNAFAWDRLYAEQSGGAFFDVVREKMKAYDFTLIDSRTGVSDTSGICTIQMPDVLVVCYTYNVQSIEGAARVARSVRASRPDLPIFPVAMRAEYQQETWLKIMREFARVRFMEFVDPSEREASKDRDAYFDRMEVPYLSQYAYWERLAAFDDRPASKSSINREMSQIASYVAGTPIGIVAADTDLRRQVTGGPAPFLALDVPGVSLEAAPVAVPKAVTFATYNELDAEAVQALPAISHSTPTAVLRATDVDEGADWEDAVRATLKRSQSMTVFIGAHGLSPRQQRELAIAYGYRAPQRQAGQRFPIVAVMMPNAAADAAAAFIDPAVELSNAPSDPKTIPEILSASSERAPACPYPGIRAFRIEDAEVFHGRERVIEVLVQEVRDGVLIEVTGPSDPGGNPWLLRV